MYSSQILRYITVYSTIAAESIGGKIVATEARTNKRAMCVAADLLAGVILFLTLMYL